MKKSLLISAAAVLIAGPAFAQGTQMPERAPAPQQSAPAEKSAPPVTTGQSEPKGIPRDAQVPPGQSRAQDEKPGRDAETTGQGTSQGDKASPGTSSQAPSSPSSSPSPAGRSPTTGQGAASTSASLTTEQRTKISASLKQQDAPPRANKVNFNTEIGTAIPGDIRRAPLPATVIDVYPVWRGYEYVMVGDEILIIDPMTLRIVAVIEA